MKTRAGLLAGCLACLITLSGQAGAQPSPEPPPPPPSEQPATTPLEQAAPVPTAEQVAPHAPVEVSPALASPDPVTMAIEQTYKPATRPTGIAALEQLWQRAADRAGARRALARALSWERRLDDALGHYDGLLAERRELDVELTLERLQVLAWMGRSDEAEAGYLAVIEQQPSNATAHAGVARMRRWRGRPLAALSAARRAVDLSPTDAIARDELALAYVALGMPDAARETVRGAPSASAETTAAIARATRVELTASTTATSDSFGIVRMSPRAKAVWGHSPDLRLQVGGGSTHMRGNGEALDYGVVGLGLSLVRARLESGVSVAAYSGRGLLLGEIGAHVVVRAHDRMKLTIGARRRPFLEVAEPLTTGEAAFFAAGAGATMLAAVARRGVDEVRVGANAAPHRGIYVYADARGMRLSDGNAGFTVASGAGADMLALVGVEAPIGLIARIDSFATGYSETRPDYFSPASFHSEMIGGQLVFRSRTVMLAGYGGANVSLGKPTSGWTAGTAIELTFASIALSARAERRDDIAYTAARAWLAMTGAL